MEGRRYFSRRTGVRGAALAVLGAVLAACAGLEFGAPRPAETPGAAADGAPPLSDSGGPTAVLPDTLRFVADAALSLPATPGVGDLVPGLPGEEGELLSSSFRSAYAEARYRGETLQGVLGGDRVHRWSGIDPAVYVQNWRSAGTAPNSWGVPALALAIRGPGDEAVFLVRGPILDAYGRGNGFGGANGPAGYGAPLGDEFPSGGGSAQRFERGLFSVAPEGSVSFTPEPPPSAALPAESGPGDPFRAARRRAADRNLDVRRPDGPARRLSVPPSAADPLPGALPRPESVWVQSFDNRAWALVLPEGAGYPATPRIVAAPFLDALLAARRQPLPGAPADASGGDDPWLAGFSAYGVPLTDVFRRGSGLAQRFAQGWMVNE